MDYLEDDCTELPDILFLDLDMPLMDGHEVLQEIRKNGSLDSPFDSNIFDLAIRTERRECATGANIYIVKPDGFEELRGTFRKAIKMTWQLPSFRI